MGEVMFVTSYSDFNVPLDEAPKRLKGKKLHKWILRSLRDRDRVSAFELSDMAYEKPDSYRALMWLESQGKFKLETEGMAYPWIRLVKG